MDKSVIYAVLIALLISLIFGIGHGIFTKYLDYKLENKNPESSGLMVEIFSWFRTLYFMLKVFIVVCAILVVSQLIKKKRMGN